MVAPRTATTSPSRLTSLSVYSPTMRSDSSAKFIAPERIRESGGINSAASNRPSNRHQPGRRYGWSLGVRPATGSAGAAPSAQQVREQNLDGSGFIRTQEQGTATLAGSVNVGNMPAVQNVN